jgi:hypothetical protein
MMYIDVSIEVHDTNKVSTDIETALIIYQSLAETWKETNQQLRHQLSEANMNLDQLNGVLAKPDSGVRF